jgi:hypothetical protein
MERPPSLPVITQDVLPGEGWAPGTYKLHGQATVFDTWKPARHRIAVLEAGTPVALLSGLSEVSKPDLVIVTSPVPELRLNLGDSLLRYTYRGEGAADLWAKGRWYSNVDAAFITNLDGTGCGSKCSAHEVEPGRKAWWFRVQLADHRIGWTSAFDSLNPN